MAPSTPRRRSGFNPLLAILLLLVGVVGTVGTLHATGQVHIEAIDRLLGREVRAADDGKVAVLISARPMKPGHRVQREDLWDPTTNVWRVVRVSKDQINEAWVLNPLEVEGRVLAREKLSGKAFSEADFLPPGSQEGAVSLVPDGMRLVSLDSSKVRGLDQLNFRDRFDLVVSEPVDPQLFQRAEEALERQGAGHVERRLELASLKEMAHQKVLVQDGVFIQDADGGTKKEKDVLVALRPEEVMPLLEALDLERSVYCVARSGKAGVEEQRTIPEHQAPLERLQWIWDTVQEIEVIEGNERRTAAVPKVD